MSLIFGRGDSSVWIVIRLWVRRANWRGIICGRGNRLCSLMRPNLCVPPRLTYDCLQLHLPSLPMCLYAVLLIPHSNIFHPDIPVERLCQLRYNYSRIISTKVPDILRDNLTVTWLQVLRKVTDLHLPDCRNALIYAHKTARSLPNCDISLGSLTILEPKAGNFLELILLYTWASTVSKAA